MVGQTTKKNKTKQSKTKQTTTHCPDAFFQIFLVCLFLILLCSKTERWGTVQIADLPYFGSFLVIVPASRAWPMVMQWDVKPAALTGNLKSHKTAVAHALALPFLFFFFLV